jgi:DNA-directed RNA polymerase subunit RPC12/RpoP
MNNTFQIRCPKCKSKFWDRAPRVQNGYSRECPYCEVVIFFEESAPNSHIRDALNEAQRLRRLARHQEASKATNTKPFVSRREQLRSAHAPSDDGSSSY